MDCKSFNSRIDEFHNLLLLNPTEFYILNQIHGNQTNTLYINAFFVGQYLIGVSRKRVNVWMTEVNKTLTFEDDLSNSLIFKTSKNSGEVFYLQSFRNRVYEVEPQGLCVQNKFCIPTKFKDFKFVNSDLVSFSTRCEGQSKIYLSPLEHLGGDFQRFLIFSSVETVKKYSLTLNKDKYHLVVFDGKGLIQYFQFTLDQNKLKTSLTLIDESLVSLFPSYTDETNIKPRKEKSTRLKKNKVYYYIKLLGDQYRETQPKSFSKGELVELDYDLVCTSFDEDSSTLFFVFSLEYETFYLSSIEYGETKSKTSLKSTIKITQNIDKSVTNQVNFRMLTFKSKYKMFIYVYGDFGINVYNLYPTQKLSFLRHKNIVVNNRCDILAIPKQKVTFLAVDDYLFMWSLSLKTRVFSKRFDSFISRIFVGNDASYLTVYDQEHFYLFNSDVLEVVFKQKCFAGHACEYHAINFDLVRDDSSIVLPKYDQETYHLLAVNHLESFSLQSFPFYSILGCFSSDTYSNHVKRLCSVYYSLSASEKRKFGIVNPFTFAIYHNDEALLKSILKSHDIPYDYKGTISVIEFAFAHKHYGLIKYFCHKLFHKQSPQYISKKDFCILLNDPKMKGNKLIANSFIGLKSLEDCTMMRVDSDIQISLNSGLKDFLYQVQENKSQKLLKADLSSVEILSTSFEYDFSIGSRESINFLDCYSQTDSKEVILSDWKHLVTFKWTRLYWANLTVALCYWLFMLVVTINILHVKTDASQVKSKWLRVLTFLFLSVFLGFEVVQLIAMSSFKLRSYFTSSQNVIDLSIVLFIIVYFSIKHKIQVQTDKLISMAVLLLVYYRGFLYLRVIPMMTYHVRIVHTIIRKMFFFLFMLFYFYFCFMLIFMRLQVTDGDDDDDDDGGSSSDRDTNYYLMSYVWIIYGGMDTSGLGQNYPVAVALIVGNILITIILVNILIAFLANLYNRLEEEEHIRKYQEMAAVVLDLEVVVYGYRKITRRTRKVRNNSQDSKSRMFIIKKKDFEESGLGESERFSRKKLKQIEARLMKFEDSQKEIMTALEKLVEKKRKESL